jgi:hypothetical protein
MYLAQLLAQRPQLLLNGAALIIVIVFLLGIYLLRVFIVGT